MTTPVRSTTTTNSVKLGVIDSGNGTVELDCTHNIFNIRQDGNITFSFSNVPTAAVITVMITRTGGHSETWPSTVTPGDVALPSPSVGPGLMDIYTLITATAGARWIIQPFALGVVL